MHERREGCLMAGRAATSEHAFLSENEELMRFFSNAVHWNSMANLNLLNDSQNLSKGHRMLEDWLSDPSVHLTSSDLLTGEVSLSFKDFKDFYDTRRASLKLRLLERVFMTESVTGSFITEDSDEEVVEEVLR